MMKSDAEGVSRRQIPAGVEVYEVNGPFFFGAADKIKDVLHFIAKKPKVFILRMRNVPAMDASGMRVLDDLFQSFSHQGIRFLIAGIHAQPLVALDKAGRLDRYGRTTSSPRSTRPWTSLGTISPSAPPRSWSCLRTPVADEARPDRLGRGLESRP